MGVINCASIKTKLTQEEIEYITKLRDKYLEKISDNIESIKSDKTARRYAFLLALKETQHQTDRFLDAYLFNHFELK